MVFDAKKINSLKLEKPILPESLKGGAATTIIDPAWDVQQKGRLGAVNHYSLMTIEQIKALPVDDLCAKDASVWLWCTAATLPHAYEILKSWGLTPRNPFVWIKNRMGLGQYGRIQCEFCILATCGKALPEIRNQPTVFYAPIQDHSHKPEELYDIIERMYPIGPRLELFARRPRHGWHAWGNEILSDIVIPGYPVPEYSPLLLNDLSKRSAENVNGKSQRGCDG